MSDLSRRDFIRLAGGLLGGVILTGCGGGDGGSVPNGYRFYRIKSTGDLVGEGSRAMTIDSFGGSVHISAGGVVTFDAHDSQKRHGLFQLDVDFNGAHPVLGRQRASLIAGDVLRDGRTVRDFAAHDVDGLGNIAAVLMPAASDQNGHYFGGLYYKQRSAEFAPVMIYGDELDGGDTTASGLFGDVALCENNGILVVANHLSNALGATSGRGLLYLADPAAQLSTAQRLVSVDHFINSTDSTITGLGLVDVGLYGDFAINVHALPPDSLLAANASGGASPSPGHYLLSGHLSAPNEHALLAAPAPTTTSIHAANIIYGPRVATDGTVFTKLGGFGGNKVEALVNGQAVIRRTNAPGPSGEYAASFTPGAIAPDGTYYYTQYVENADDTVSIDLLMYDGRSHYPILSVGDQIVNVEQPISNIVFATTTNHVDANNRIVMLCQFGDGSTGLVVGVPV